MNPIRANTWGQSSQYSWGDINSNQWEDYRLALMESMTDMTVHGFSIKYASATSEVVTDMSVQGVGVKYSSVVMAAIGEVIASTASPNKNYYLNMIERLPHYERSSYIFNTILEVHAQEFNKIGQQVGIYNRNLLLDTSAESLDIHERDLGITDISGLEYDQRREQVISRYISLFDQTTVEAIKEVTNSYYNGEVSISDVNEEGIFTVKFISTMGVPNNIEGLKQALDIVIPAHLKAIYEFSYVIWDDITLTWDDYLDITWDELRELEALINETNK